MKRARPFSTEGGRKWIAMWYLQGLGVFILALIVLKAVMKPLEDLDIDQLVQVFVLMATITGTFVGVQGAIDFRSAKSANGSTAIDAAGEATNTATVDDA